MFLRDMDGSNSVYSSHVETIKTYVCRRIVSAASPACVSHVQKLTSVTNMTEGKLNVRKVRVGTCFSQSLLYVQPGNSIRLDP